MTTEPATRASVACRICGSDRLTLRGSRRGTFIARDFDFWHCATCDFLFVDPFPGYAVYDEAYYRGRGPDPFVDYESEYRDYRATDRLVEFDDLWRVGSGYIEGHLPEGTVEWLDFGCGAGGLLKYIRDRGEVASGDRRWAVRLTGHDVGTYAERLKASDGFRILALDELASEKEASYDIISLIEVVEHLEFPDAVFDLAARLLRPGGLLLVTTGNIGSFMARSQGLNYGYVLPEVHVGYFTPRSLEIIYRRHGLVPLRNRYDGVVRFKVLKTLRTRGRQRLARLAMRLPFVVRAIDGIFGTSDMPCGMKPR